MSFTATRASLVQQLTDLFLEVPVGGLLSYDSIWSVIGPDIQKNRPIIYKAIDNVAKTDGRIFECENRVGYRRKRNGEAASLGKTVRTRYNRAVSRTSNRIGLAVTLGNDLTNDEILNAAAEQRVLSSIRSLTHDSIVTKERVEIIEEFPSLAEAAAACLEIMRESRRRKRR